MKKKSFLERLTGSIRFEDNEENEEEFSFNDSKKKSDTSDRPIIRGNDSKEAKWEEELDAELTVDVYQTPTDIIVQTMAAGVQPQNPSLTLNRDMITIRGT